MRREDGSLTTNLSETSEVLLKTMFPGSSVSSCPDWPDLAGPPPSAEDWEVANRTVEDTKVTWAINTFLPFKSPGIDGVFPALLQWGLTHILGHLVRIYRACLAFKYTPVSWREVKVIFIPKPGRTDYSLPKSYRPISLTSFLLKGLERLCDREIRDTVLVLHPLHPNQHAYIPGRSTESALHCVVNRIQKSLDTKMSTLGVFIDIEGAFDKTTFESIDIALHSHAVPNTLIEWIKHMLKWRAITINIGNIETRGVVSRGCPQGGVLSPLLWIIVVDSLLRRLNESGFFTTGYADDITILLNGNFEGPLCELMQTALKIVDNWCIEHSLSVNPQKTELLLFTRKRKLGNMKMPKLAGTQLHLTSEVKYLGVVLDPALNWRRHIEAKINKACAAFWQCRRAVGRSWGLSPRISLWLYTAVIRPMLCYAAIVWWPRVRQRTTASRLEHVQRLACLCATGAMKTTPTAAMEAILCITPLNLFIEEAALRTALRLESVGLWHIKGGITRHARILEEATTTDPLLKMSNDRIPPIYNFKKNFEVRLTTSGSDLPDVSIYTDGSKMDCGSGAGVYSEDLNLHSTIPLGTYTTIFQAELVGIMVAATESTEANLSGKTVRISTDSRAALLALDNCRINSGLVLQVREAVDKLAQNNNVQLCWVKGHDGNQGNEEADALARQGSEGAPYGPEPTIALSEAVHDTLIKNRVLKRHTDWWTNLSSCRHSRMAVAAPSLKLGKQCLQLSRNNLRILVGLLTGHCRLNKHLHTLGVVDNPRCRGCNLEDETAEHVLCHCPALSTKRGSILGDFWPSMARIGSSPPGLLLKYIKTVGWLEE